MDMNSIYQIIATLTPSYIITLIIPQLSQQFDQYFRFFKLDF